MSIEGPDGSGPSAEQKRNPVEQLEKEIKQQEEILPQNEDKLKELYASLEDEKSRDPVEIAKRREAMLEKLDRLKSKINSKLEGRIPAYAILGTGIVTMFSSTDAETWERAISMSGGAAVGAALAGVVWGAQRIKFAIENRNAYQEARGEQN